MKTNYNTDYSQHANRGLVYIPAKWYSVRDYVNKAIKQNPSKVLLPHACIHTIQTQVMTINKIHLIAAFLSRHPTMSCWIPPNFPGACAPIRQCCVAPICNTKGGTWKNIKFPLLPGDIYNNSCRSIYQLTATIDRHVGIYAQRRDAYISQSWLMPSKESGWGVASGHWPSRFEFE